MSAFYDLASLVLVPSGYKAQKVYAQKPLTTDGQLTFSRASTATRVNSAGLIETVSSNVPRLDYLGSTCPKLLLEPQRQNLAIQNTAFDNAAWTKTDVTVTANAVASPDGTTNADAVIEDTASSSGRRVLPTLPFSGTGGAYYTFSVYVKKIAGQPTRHIYWMCQNGVNAIYAHFNMTTFAVHQVTASGSGSNASATITAVGSDWYRLTLSGVVSSATADYYNQFYFEDSPQTGFSPQTYTGNGTSGFYLYGWQIEQGAYVTSLIQTTTAAVTRLGDALYDESASSLIGQTEGTLFVQFKALTQNNSGASRISISSGTTANWIFVGTESNNIRGYVRGSNSVIISNTSVAITGNDKVAIAYKTGSLALYINGVQIATSSSTLTFNAALDDISTSVAGSYTIDDTLSVNQLMVFKTRLTNAQLAELTAL